MLKLLVEFAKYIIFVFNFIFVILGALLILFGLLPIVNGGYDSTYSKIAIIVGTLVFVISFLGCCGAVRENKTLLTAHAVVLLILFVSQMIIILLLLVAGIDDDYKNIDARLSRFIYSQDDGDLQIMREVELWLKCCGVNNSTDYTNRGMFLPGSCCGETIDVDSFNNERMCTSGMEYQDGCGPKLRNYIEENYNYVSCIVIGLAVFEILGGAFTLWTRDHISSNKFDV